MALQVMVLRPVHVRIQGKNVRQMANANVNGTVWTVIIMDRVPVTMVRYVVRMENVDPVLAGPALNISNVYDHSSLYQTCSFYFYKDLVLFYMIINVVQKVRIM